MTISSLRPDAYFKQHKQYIFDVRLTCYGLQSQCRRFCTENCFLNMNKVPTLLLTYSRVMFNHKRKEIHQLFSCAVLNKYE